MKRFSIVALLAVAMVVAFAGAAYANFGPHGGYEADTDACAGCHRAHTSFSDVTWTDQFDNEHTALLVGNTATISEFCYVCHGDDAPGASTNVVSGIFDSGPSGEDGDLVGGDNGGVAVLYETNSTFNAGLNGGGFSQTADYLTGALEAATSMHDMDAGAATDPMWGDNNVAPIGTNLTCTDCHDPHGSSNYRLLKDSVNGHTVGGYPDGETPNPFVISAEEGYPVAGTPGWLKHEDGADQMDLYRPNYTAPEYAFMEPVGAEQRSISAWCAACHEQYIIRESDYDYGTWEPFGNAGGAASVGNQTRHRHPVNITLAAGVGPARSLEAEVVTSTHLPLEQRPSNIDRTRVWDTSDYLGCLTCHRAHGSSAAMSGWAEATYEESAGVWLPRLDPGTGGVDPNKSSALLRTDNRGVCERCHNK